MAQTYTNSIWFPNGGYVLAVVDRFDPAPVIRPLRKDDLDYQELPIYVRRGGVALTGLVGSVYLIAVEPENHPCPGPVVNWVPVMQPESEDDLSAYCDVVGYLLEYDNLDAESASFALECIAKITEKVAAAYASYIGEAFENGAIRA
jgi:hypothetical protein